MRALLVSPVDPGTSGSGLAMRAAMWRRALAHVAEVEVAVLPLAGGPATVDLPADPVAATVQSLADSRWREFLVATDPLPRSVGTAFPSVGAEWATTRRPCDLVLAFRSYTTPFCLGVISAWEGARLLVDLDDDDAAMNFSLGDQVEALAAERLVDALRESATMLVAAAPGIGGADVVPNAFGARDISTTPVPPGARMLMVGNFTYGPNRHGAQWFAGAVLPSILERVPKASLRLVGRGGESMTFGYDDGVVRALGFVDQLAPEYGAATAVVVPLLHGSGTSIKVLEAFAHGRPVAGTTVGFRGLDIRDGTHALVADDAERLADAVVRLLREPEPARRIAAAGRALVVDRYDDSVIDPHIAELVTLCMTSR